MKIIDERETQKKQKQKTHTHSKDRKEKGGTVTEWELNDFAVHLS